MGKLDKAETAARVVKLGLEAWSIYVEKRRKAAEQEARIKELEKEVEQLKKGKKK